MSEAIKGLWAQTKLLVWPENYYLISLPAGEYKAAVLLMSAAPVFAAIIKERDEVSLTMDEKTHARLSQQLEVRAVAGPYRVITFNLNLDLSVCGYFALAAERLAGAGISIVPQCAFLKDHVLIQAEKIEHAAQVLQELIEECRRI